MPKLDFVIRELQEAVEALQRAQMIGRDILTSEAAKRKLQETSIAAARSRVVAAYFALERM